MEPIPMSPMLILGKSETDSLVCVIAELPDEPGVVGIMLADTIRHVANAYCGAGESQRKAEVVLEIWAMLQAEMSNPTSETSMMTESGVIMLADLTVGEE